MWAAAAALHSAQEGQIAHLACLIGMPKTTTAASGSEQLRIARSGLTVSLAGLAERLSVAGPAEVRRTTQQQLCGSDGGPIEPRPSFSSAWKDGTGWTIPTSSQAGRQSPRRANGQECRGHPHRWPWQAASPQGPAASVFGSASSGVGRGGGGNILLSPLSPSLALATHGIGWLPRRRSGSPSCWDIDQGSP